MAIDPFYWPHSQPSEIIAGQLTAIPVLMKWQVNSKGQFYDPGEGTLVYFDAASGDTHLINEFAAYIVRHLTTRPMDIETLIKHISPGLEHDDLAELIQAMPDVMTELVALEIVQSV